MADDKALTIVQIDSAAVMPVFSIEAALERRSQVVTFIKRIMREGEDYGTIPGTGDKKTLLKPGAEKLATFFGLSKRFVLLDKVLDWDKPFFLFNYRSQLYRGDLLIAEADGSCNSHEAKYRYRQGERLCPKCGKPNIRKSKKDDSWYCWTKTGGCGATFQKGDVAINGQQVGRIENPDVADLVNTIQKMAQKRALVAAVLLAVNASEYFTQDVEDFDDSIIEGEFTKTQPEPPPPPDPSQNEGKPTNGNGDIHDPERIESTSKPMSKTDFYRAVLKAIPYYRHVNHVNNTLPLCGFPDGYKAGQEDAMITALQQYATAKANEEAAKG